MNLKTIGELNFIATAGNYLEVNKLRKNSEKHTQLLKQLVAQKTTYDKSVEQQTNASLQLEQQKAIREQIESLKKQHQQFLRDTYFEVRSKINEILSFKDNLSKFIYLKRLKNDMTKLEFLNPNQFESIQDKEYGMETIKLYDNNLESVINSFTDEENKDLEFLMSLNTKKENLETENKAAEKLYSNTKKEFDSSIAKLKKSREKLEKNKVNLTELSSKEFKVGFWGKLGSKINDKRQESLTDENNNLDTLINELEKKIIPQLTSNLQPQKAMLEETSNKLDLFNREIHNFFIKYPKLDFLRGFWSSLLNRGIAV